MDRFTDRGILLLKTKVDKKRSVIIGVGLWIFCVSPFFSKQISLVMQVAIDVFMAVFIYLLDAISSKVFSVYDRVIVISYPFLPFNNDKKFYIENILAITIDMPSGKSRTPFIKFRLNIDGKILIKDIFLAAQILSKSKY